MTAALRRAYADLAAGVEPSEPTGRRIALLVGTTRVSLGREDTIAAAGLGRQLAGLGLGVRLIPPDRWYATGYADGELLIALVPGVDARRLPGRVPVVAWIRSQVEKWLALPALGEFTAVLAASELARDAVAARYGGPVGVLPAGFDHDLFTAGPDKHRRTRIVVPAPDRRQHDRGVHAATRLLPVGTPLDWFGADAQDVLIARFRRGGRDPFPLARAYRTAVLSVTEQDDASVGWGTQPVGLFEALASGSPVATNTRVGLRELGLEDLPVYRSARDLVELIGRARAGELNGSAQGLRDTVRARHNYGVRATALLDFAAEHELWCPPPRPAAVLNFVPDWTVSNPYQRMLYEQLPDWVRAVPTADAVSHLVLRDDGGDLTGQILHVHWQNIVAQPAANHAEASRRVQSFTQTVTDLLERGMKLVWTVHNRMPHELDYYFHELEICRFLARNADVVHVLSEETVDAVRDLFELDPARVVVVKHGSYVGAYPDLLDRAAARKRLSLLPSERVVLFFGAIRPYKGLEQLVEAFTRIHRTDPATRLLVVGRPDRAMNEQFMKRLRLLPFVTTNVSFVPESDVHLYFRAADLQVAPYGSVLNSGSVLLGLGFGLPVVAPALGALRSLGHEPFMFPYRAGNVAELEQALRDGLDASRAPTLSEQALGFARQYDGRDMSEAFVRDVLSRVLDPAATDPLAAASGD